MLDLTRFLEFLTDACAHYEQSAPTVAAYLDSLYIRINEQPADVRLVELLRVRRLWAEGTWMEANYAANFVYHLEYEIGRDVTGQAGF